MKIVYEQLNTAQTPQQIATLTWIDETRVLASLQRLERLGKVVRIGKRYKLQEEKGYALR